MRIQANGAGRGRMAERHGDCGKKVGGEGVKLVTIRFPELQASRSLKGRPKLGVEMGGETVVAELN